MDERGISAMDNGPPELVEDGVPFESPSARVPLVRRAARRFHRYREKPLSPSAVAVSLFVYALGASVTGYYGSGLLLFAWLMAGPLGVTVYLTFDGRGSLLNPYTLFFAAIVSASVALHFLQN